MQEVVGSIPISSTFHSTTNMLKILAGRDRGRPIKKLKSPLVRPILARIKKSVFDIIAPRLPGSRFLDLYAGSGSVGLEALSRGASRAVFVEQDPACARIIRENVATFKNEAHSSILRLNAAQDLSAVPGPFDLIFMGPPYKDAEKNPLALVVPTLGAIRNAHLAAEGALVIAQHHKKETVNPDPNEWTIVRVEEYGDTKVTFLKPRP